MKLYGIPNCNTVKKARDWLERHQVAYEFHDFKKLGLSEMLASNWLNQVDTSKLINQSGLTWRGLDPEIKNNLADHASVIALMISKTSVIKRPILEKDDKILALGFSESEYDAVFKSLNIQL
jgi:Spx/MgsR family transcriptional regulator